MRPRDRDIGTIFAGEDGAAGAGIGIKSSCIVLYLSALGILLWRGPERCVNSDRQTGIY